MGIRKCPIHEVCQRSSVFMVYRMGIQFALWEVQPQINELGAMSPCSPDKSPVLVYYVVVITTDSSAKTNITSFVPIITNNQKITFLINCWSSESQGTKYLWSKELSQNWVKIFYLPIYTLHQKKQNFNLPIFPGAPGSQILTEGLSTTPRHAYSLKCRRKGGQKDRRSTKRIVSLASQSITMNFLHSP